MPEEFVPKVTDEMWLSQKVYGDRMMSLFEGVTTVSQRRQKMRDAITRLGIEDKKLGKSDTYVSAFERLYRQMFLVEQLSEKTALSSCA